MVPQHGHARQPAHAHDDLEGAPRSPGSRHRASSRGRSADPGLRSRPQSKLATIRNANSEDEIDDSMLQLGLLAYPVLQAADVLLYKCALLSLASERWTLTSDADAPRLALQDLTRARRPRPVAAPRARARPRPDLQPRLPGPKKGRQGQGQGRLQGARGHAQCVGRSPSRSNRSSSSRPAADLPGCALSSRLQLPTLASSRCGIRRRR